MQGLRQHSSLALAVAAESLGMQEGKGTLLNLLHPQPTPPYHAQYFFAIRRSLCQWIPFCKYVSLFLGVCHSDGRVFYFLIISMSEAKHKWPSFGLVKHLQESIFAILCLLGRFGQTPLLSANSNQIQQEAIHHKRFTVLTNSKGFSLQLIGIWPKPYPIWPSSQLCQVFRGPPLPTCRQQRENSFRTLRMCICLRLYSYLVHTHMLPLI